MSDSRIGRGPIANRACPPYSRAMSQSLSRCAFAAKHARWYGRWGHLLAGVFVGVLIVTPVLATTIIR